MYPQYPSLPVEAFETQAQNFSSTQTIRSHHQQHSEVPPAWRLGLPDGSQESDEHPSMAKRVVDAPLNGFAGLEHSSKSSDEADR
jgi:hypothetical protein